MTKLFLEGHSQRQLSPPELTNLFVCFQAVPITLFITEFQKTGLLRPPGLAAVAISAKCKCCHCRIHLSNSINQHRNKNHSFQLMQEKLEQNVSFEKKKRRGMTHFTKKLHFTPIFQNANYLQVICDDNLKHKKRTDFTYTPPVHKTV